MRLSRRSCRISSALRKQANGRKRRAQQRASTQVDVTSEPPGSYVQRQHTGVYLQVVFTCIYNTVRGVPADRCEAAWQPDTSCRRWTVGP